MISVECLQQQDSLRQIFIDGLWLYEVVEISILDCPANIGQLLQRPYC